MDNLIDDSDVSDVQLYIFNASDILTEVRHTQINKEEKIVNKEVVHCVAFANITEHLDVLPLTVGVSTIDDACVDLRAAGHFGEHSVYDYPGDIFWGSVSVAAAASTEGVVELPIMRKVSGVYIEASGLKDYIIKQMNIAEPEDSKITMLIHDEYNEMDFRGYPLFNTKVGGEVHYQARGSYDAKSDYIYKAPVQINDSPNFYLVGGTPYPGFQTDVRIFYDEQELPISPISTPDMRLIDGVLNVFRLHFGTDNEVSVDVKRTGWDGQTEIDKGW
jgi:hypothetical protein